MVRLIGGRKKRIIGAIYGIFFEDILGRFCNWLGKFEKKYLGYCAHGCENCYKWKCAVRSNGETPYKKFRKPPFPMD